MHVKRRTFLLGLAGFSLPIAAASCTQSVQQSNSNTAASPASASEQPDRIRVGYQVYAGSELLAKGLGLAKQFFPDVNVEYLRFDAGRDVNVAMAANGIDLGLVGSTAAAVGISSGLDYQVFYLYDLIGKLEALVVKNTIQAIADLRGKKIAVPYSSTDHYSLLSFLKLEQINQTELQILDMVAPDMLAAWQRGDIDGGYVWEPTLSRMQQDGGRILTTSEDLAKRGYATFDVAVVRTEFAQQYPNALKQYQSMLDQSVKIYRDDPQTAAKALAAELGVSPQEALTQAGQVIWLDSTDQANSKYLGTADQPGAIIKGLKDTADFMVEQKAIPTAPSEDTYRQRILYL